VILNAILPSKHSLGSLGVKKLRDYFRKPGNGDFWLDHIKRYSKSRRKASIYWYLRAAKGNYGLWRYHHRLDKDILFKALLNYVEPKIRLEEDRLNTLRSRKEAAGSSGREVKQLEKDMDRPGTVCLRAARFGPKCSPHAYHTLIELEEASHTGYNQRHTTADEEGKLPGGVAMVREDSPSDRRWGDRAAFDEELDAFEHMRPLILKALQSPLSEKEFAVKLNIPPGQAREWLKRAVKEGKVKKTKRPVRYVLGHDRQMTIPGLGPLNPDSERKQSGGKP
jgi:hypothetical protein